MNYLTSDSEKWDKMFAWLYDNFMFLMDLIQNTKLPLTDISIGYWLFFWMIVRLSIYAVNGTGTQYNNMASELHNNTSNAYSKSKIAKYTPGTQSSKKRKLSKHNIKENHRNLKNTQLEKRKLKIIKVNLVV